ncbi:MAG: zinc carboxypeptidase [Sphingobacteriia bacterium]|nr:MAG: zinc carboxypeptidase [Sphingobacteriia bacterium]
MLKTTWVLVGTLFFTLSSLAQTLTSPEQFLGYPVGTQFTRHHRIVEYAKAVAAANSAQVKVIPYGETNEGRELNLVVVSSPENMRNLEQIRLNNLRLAGLTKDRMAPQTENAPAILWLSYNVHGNEASSSEAFLLTLYAMANSTQQNVQAWLKNTVVVMDPCINPDGRDRYINWYNSVVGKKFNADPASREHAEPWPGGRSNHYNFDLNRDWAWQTQIETQQRLKKYQEWMPQVHVDYHEQGFNEPYYFAPAAEPFHEVITPWQRQFQELIGKNHAAYFDAKNWLYFTKERFDLLYPSYGDTYPIYNGAIGMTYEQGGIRAGLAILNEDGDTLTLTDRAQHHFTTGLSTLETVSKHQAKLVQSFKQFFDDSRQAQNSVYKTYVFTHKEEAKLLALKKLLDNNGIQSGSLNNKTFSGYNYFSGKEEGFADEGFHLAVTAAQPKGVLARVLLEPKTAVSDSNTYDITAWSAAYAHGIKAYAVKEKLSVGVPAAPAPKASVAANGFGWLIPYNGFHSAQLLSQLLQANIKVRWAEKPFVYNGKTWDRGSLIVLKTSNAPSALEQTRQLCDRLRISPEALSSGWMDKGSDLGSPDIHVLAKAPKVALLTGEGASSLGAGEVWHYFDRILDYPLTLLNANDLGRLDLKNYQVLIIPDGSYRFFSDKSTADKLKDFVRTGGKLIALENAVAQMATSDWGIKMKETKSEANNTEVKKFGDRERDFLDQSIPGAIYKMDLDNTHPLGFGYPNFYHTLKQDDNLYEWLKEGWNVGTLKKDNYITGYAGSKVKAKLKDGLLLGVQSLGRGSVVYFAEDPLFRNFWENGFLLFANAVFLVGQ